jgi:diguanylate cyclase (GGDEF)-like protein
MPLPDFSERVQERLRALAETFTQQLPDRMRDIAGTAQQALEDNPDPAALSSLRMHVHKLAGSAASFGFHHVTVCAKRLEHVIDTVIEEDGRMDGTARKRIRMLVSELGEATQSHHRESGEEELEELAPDTEADDRFDAVAQARPEAAATEGGLSPVSQAAPAQPDGQRVVSILLQDGQLSRQLADQLSFFGFETRQPADFGELESMAREHCGQALVLDAALVLDDPARLELLNKLRATCGEQLRIVYISDRDDFDTRLLAVRTGGDAFLSLPVDVPRLIDKVDSLTMPVSEEPYHVLIVDDDMEQVSYHAMILQQAGMITSVVSDPENMFSILIECKPELILMDMYMPGCSGVELATIVRQQEAFVDIPIVFLSIETDAEKQMQAVSQGGDGFLAKPIKPEHLVTTVANRVERTRSMRFYMERDSLTGLLNHTHLIQSLSQEIQRAERVNRPVCFAMIDIDHFKQVNDTYGHLTGDRVLKSLSRYLQDRLRKTDIVGRYGGEEFGIVLFNVDLENAVRVMDKIRAEFARITHEAGEEQFSVSFSCGIASYPAFDGPGPITEAADRALYAAKDGGRNRVVSS